MTGHWSSPLDQTFETFFSRQDGFKMERVERSSRPYRRDRFVLWGDQRCLRSYIDGLGGKYLRDCFRPEAYVGGGTLAVAEHLVPSYLIEKLQHFGAGSRTKATRVDEAQTPQGRKAHVLVEEKDDGSVQKTWTDPISHHIIRYEYSRHSQLITIEYDIIELDPSLQAAAVRFEPPFLVRYTWQVIYGALLAVPSGLLFWLGWRSGRRGPRSWKGSAIRAGLWSLALCWSLVAGPVGHGAFLLPLPSWVVLVLGLLLGAGAAPQTVAIPSPWLSPAVPIAAYVLGALLPAEKGKPR